MPVSRYTTNNNQLHNNYGSNFIFKGLLIVAVGYEETKSQLAYIKVGMVFPFSLWVQVLLAVSSLFEPLV